MQPMCLATANDSRHDEIVSRTKSAIQELRLLGERISFYAVADKAQVSRSTLYRCEDLRKLVEEARRDVASHHFDFAGRDDRVAELERELARVSRERDELMRAACHAPSVRYTFARIPEAA